MKQRKFKSGLGTIIVGAVLAIALVATFWTPYDPLVLDFTARLAAPTRSAPMNSAATF